MTSQPDKNSEKKKPTFGHRLGMKGFLLMEGMLKLIGMKTLDRFGRGVGAVAWRVLPERRRIVERNLRIVVDSKLQGEELRQMSLENFKRTISSFLCSAKTATLTDDELKSCVEIVGRDAFVSAVRQGRGMVCAVAHMGNWEALARIRIFYPEIERYGSMYRQFDNPLLEEYVYKRRTERGTQMFSKEGGIRSPMKFLKEAANLGVLSDQFTWEGVYVPFYGKVTGTTPLPALLRRRAGADMVAVAVRSNGVGQWISDMGNQIDFSQSDGTLLGDTLIVNQALEELINKSVLDEFWMHHRWKSVAKFPEVDDKCKHLLSQLELKPHRVVLSMPKELDKALCVAPFVRALRAYRPDMQVSVVCASEQRGVWQSMPEVSYVLPNNPQELALALEEEKFYADGPLDRVIFFDNDEAIVKCFVPHGPMIFNGFSSHPGVKKYRFKGHVAELKDGAPGHWIQSVQRLAKAISIDMLKPEFYPAKKDGVSSDSPVLLSPFSEFGRANEWGDEQWKEVLSALPAKVILVATESNRERAKELATQWGVEAFVGDYAQLIPVIDHAKALVAVDGYLPALCSFRGVPSVCVYSTRLPDMYRPLGQFNRSLYKHQCCSPCYLKECDRDEPCNRQISATEILSALQEVLN